MLKTLYYIFLGFGIIGGLILYFQNTISSYTLYTPFGPKASSVIILYSISLGFFSGFGLAGIMKKDDETDLDEHF